MNEGYGLLEPIIEPKGGKLGIPGECRRRQDEATVTRGLKMLSPRTIILQIAIFPSVEGREKPGRGENGFSF
jgi:hypothetical protein